jgi:hypothetical protein
VAAQEDDEEGDGDDEVVVSGQDYHPDVDFDVVSEFESGTRDDLLESFDDEFESPGDWDAYAVDFDMGTGTSLGYIFVDEDDADVSAGDSGTMTGTASFRNAEMNLLEVEITTEAAPEDEENGADEPANGADEPANGGGDTEPANGEEEGNGGAMG